MFGRDIKNWIAHAEQKAVQQVIAHGGPYHFALTLEYRDGPSGCH